MHQQRQAELFHARQRRVAFLAKVGHAGIGIGRRAGRVELHRLTKPLAARGAISPAGVLSVR
jgi:hypothetical protein